MSDDSLFRSSARSFLVTFFGILGLIVAIFLVTLVVGVIYSSSKKEESFNSKTTLLPDADGHRKKLASNTPIVLQITIDGKIGTDELTGKKVEELLLDSREGAFKDRVKALFLVINSPGGGVNDSDIIYRHLKEYKEKYKVPIYAFVNGLCASGGYYIAVAADKIFASDVSIIGSIGVVSWPPFFNVSKVLEKVGIDSVTISAGKGKDEMNAFRPWKQDEQKNYQALISYFYEQFVNHVTQARPQIDREKLIQVWGAKIFTPPEAVENGLIDFQKAVRNEVLKQLVQAASIKDHYQVVGFETKSWWRKLFHETSTSPLFTGKFSHEISYPHPEIHSLNYL